MYLLFNSDLHLKLGKFTFTGFLWDFSLHVWFSLSAWTRYIYLIWFSGPFLHAPGSLQGVWVHLQQRVTSYLTWRKQISRKLSSEGSTAEIDLWEFVKKKWLEKKNKLYFCRRSWGDGKGSIYTCSAVTGTAFHPVILSSSQWDLELAAHSISTWKSDSNSFPFNLRGGGAQMDRMNYNPNAI